jgi:hypothetical protein
MKLIKALKSTKGQKGSGTAKSGATETLQPTSETSQTASGQSSSKVVPLRPAKAGPTQEQIAERAHAIWLQHGCDASRDQANWLEAEAQLKAELGSK